MTNNDTGKFRGCWMFDTHDAVYHLNNDNSIIGVQCHAIRDQVIGIQSDNKVGGFIGNPGVFALSKSTEDTDIYRVLQELNATYKERIMRWLGEENYIDGHQKKAA